MVQPESSDRLSALFPKIKIRQKKKRQPGAHTPPLPPASLHIRRFCFNTYGRVYLVPVKGNLVWKGYRQTFGLGRVLAVLCPCLGVFRVRFGLSHPPLSLPSTPAPSILRSPQQILKQDTPRSLLSPFSCFSYNFRFCHFEDGSPFAPTCPTLAPRPPAHHPPPSAAPPNPFSAPPTPPLPQPNTSGPPPKPNLSG